MSDADKENRKPNEPRPTGVSPEKAGGKRGAANDKLRKKLEKLKKNDPNIYPVF
ncbi:MAG: hypothetical protein P1U64_09915 [Alcanivoracaceae bacterium]|nr:hypothetical protein [Alcanivoracaceae bacterium]